MAKIKLNDYVKTPKGEGWVLGYNLEQKPGTAVLVRTGEDHLKDWFSCLIEEVIISEPSEEKILDLEFWTLRKKWLDILK